MNNESENPTQLAAPSGSTALAELAAMRTCHDALKELPHEASERCLQWLAATIGIGTPRPANPAGKVNQPQPTPQNSLATREFTDLPSLFAAAQAETQADKALVVSYWLQSRGDEDLDSQQINSELKHLGHGVGNITRALDALIDSRPALLIQTRKEGTAKQARKRYKLTIEGKNRVLTLLAQQSGGERG